MILIWAILAHMHLCVKEAEQLDHGLGLFTVLWKKEFSSSFESEVTTALSKCEHWNNFFVENPVSL